MDKKLIVQQNTEEMRRIKYGAFPMSFNGCEIIAVYNALVMSGVKCDLQELIDCFKKKHLMLLWGLFGSYVFGLHKVLQGYGIRAERVKLCDIKDDGLYIVSFWNRRPPWHGIHTVLTQVQGGKHITYNLYSNRGVEPLSPGEYVGGRYIVGYKIGHK